MDAEMEDLAREVIICSRLRRDATMDCKITIKTVNTDINLLAGVTDGTSALDQNHIVILVATVVPVVNHAVNPEMILILRC